MQTEHPIIFNGDMVQAILGDRKTQTRRVIKDPRISRIPAPLSSGSMGGIYSIADGEAELRLSKNEPPNFPCPYGVPGNNLWVREKHYRWTGCGEAPSYWRRSPAKETYQSRGYFDDGENYEIHNHSSASVVIPSIHMFRWASRINLEITNIRVEQIQDISGSDCFLEGIEKWVDYKGGYSISFLQARGRFHALWDSINAKKGYGWEINPWVWVIKFKVLEG